VYTATVEGENSETTSEAAKNNTHDSEGQQDIIPTKNNGNIDETVSQKSVNSSISVVELEGNGQAAAATSEAAANSAE
jgi:hypothetical protein